MPSPADTALTILNSIDGPSLREQRYRLLLMLARYSDRKTTDPELVANRDALEGIQNLLDVIADFCADELGKDCLLVSDFSEEE